MPFVSGFINFFYISCLELNWKKIILLGVAIYFNVIFEVKIFRVLFYLIFKDINIRIANIFFSFLFIWFIGFKLTINKVFYKFIL